jgi:hypothetical protein
MTSKTRNYQPVPLDEIIHFTDDLRRKEIATVEHKGYDLFTCGKRFNVEKNDFYKKYISLFDVLYWNVGVFYSVAPNYFPEKMSLVRSIDNKIVDIINLYYSRVSLDPPTIQQEGDELYVPVSYPTSQEKVVVGLSGGKDSVYVLVKAMEEYGKDNVVAVYVDNIMGICPEQERAACNIVCEKLGIRLVSLKIKNSFKKHRGILNGAEISMAVALIIPIAVYFNAYKVIMGTIQTETDIFQVQPPTFSETMPAIELFNDFLSNIGLNIKMVSGVPETKVPLIYLMQNYPDIMKETVSCMMLSGFLVSHRKRAIRNYPEFPFYERMCGVCAKCMMINVFRMRYQDDVKKVLMKESVYKYCRRVFKATTLKRNDFKVDIIDEIEDILDDAIFTYESNIEV